MREIFAEKGTAQPHSAERSRSVGNDNITVAVEIGQAAEAGAYDEDFTMLWGVPLGVHVNLSDGR
ncbi:hypothetical protein [Kytococcus sedentarius]|uniref:hypothetical protein n=1 Tax=Kytococcus sedentarius TaxID=1276 RepID=UPI0038516562